MNDSTIPTEFDKYGQHFTQTRRVGNVVQYLRAKVNGEPVGCEVMVIRMRKESVLHGKVMAGGESLPSPSQWGTFGWSYLKGEEDKADQRFAICCKQFNMRRIVRRVA